MNNKSTRANSVQKEHFVEYQPLLLASHVAFRTDLFWDASRDVPEPEPIATTALGCVTDELLLLTDAWVLEAEEGNGLQATISVLFQTCSDDWQLRSTGHITLWCVHFFYSVLLLLCMSLSVECAFDGCIAAFFGMFP